MNLFDHFSRKIFEELNSSRNHPKITPGISLAISSDMPWSLFQEFLHQLLHEFHWKLFQKPFGKNIVETFYEIPPEILRPLLQEIAR